MDLELALADEFALTAFDSKGLSEQGTALRHLVRDVYEEVQQGAAIRHTFQVVMGQKPNTRDRDQGVKEEKPTILFVPGAFHTEAHFQPLSDILEKSSFPTVTASPPTQTHPGVEMNYKEDIKSVRLLLETLVNKEGREVILVPHSYGGVIASQAVKGLERSQIRAEGRPGGIIQVFFINALFVAKGQFLDEALDAGKLPDWAVFKVSIFSNRNRVKRSPSSYLLTTLLCRMVCSSLGRPSPYSSTTCRLQKLITGTRYWCRSHPVEPVEMSLISAMTST